MVSTENVPANSVCSTLAAVRRARRWSELSESRSGTGNPLGKRRRDHITQPELSQYRCIDTGAPIDYRRWSMDVDRTSAEVWASWFRALGDATRVLILHRLATARRPMTVGEVVAAVDVGQSTVSHHLKLLADTGFVHVERRGTARLYRVNERCLACFPSAAEVVMGRLPRYDPAPASCTAPWQTDEAVPRRRDGNETIGREATL